MIFTTGLCMVAAVLATLKVHPLQVITMAAFFSVAVAVVVVQIELAYIASGTRDRQRRGRLDDDR